MCLSCRGGSHSEWADAVALLKDVTTCATYGRPGLGGSDPLPADRARQARTGSWAANELRTLLQRVGIAPPYVFAASAVGAYVADQFVPAWPAEVAGLVLIDPTNITSRPVRLGATSHPHERIKGRVL